MRTKVVFSTLEGVGIALAVLLAAAAPSWGSTFVLMSDAQLASASNGAWLATVQSVTSGMTPQGRVYTYVTLLADSKLSGPADMPEEIVLRELGGRVGDTEMVVYGAPGFSAGEQVLVFLEQAGDGTLRTYQHAMGKFRVQREASTGEAVAVRDWGSNPGRVRVASPTSGAISEAHADSRPLSEILDTIRSATAATGPAPLSRQIVARPAELDRMHTETAASPDYSYLGYPSRTTVFPGSLAYIIDATPPATISGYVTALEGSMLAWEHLTNNISMVNGGTADLIEGYGGCGGNRIVNEDPAGDISNPTGCSGALALGGYCTQGSHVGPRGTNYRTIVSSKVVFADGWGGCGVWNVDNYTEIGAHELGHSIGFGHSANASVPDTSLTEAVMYWRCCQGRGGDAAGVTTQDDKMIAAHAYPSGATAPYYVLDGFGGLHPGDGAPTSSSLPPYFGFDIARDLALTGTGKGLVLDGLGGVHAFGGEPAPSPSTPYFGFDAAVAIAVVPGTSKFYVIDFFGALHLGNGAAPAPSLPYFGFDIARDVEAVADGAVYALDGFGGVHAAGGAPTIVPMTPYFGFDIARDMVFVETGDRYYVIDGFGGLYRGGYPADITPATPQFGADVVTAAILFADDVAILVLDVYGGVHPGGGAGPWGQSTPYFGFDILRGARLAR